MIMTVGRVHTVFATHIIGLCNFGHLAGCFIECIVVTLLSSHLCS